MCSFKVRRLTKAPDDQKFHLIQWKKAMTNSRMWLPLAHLLLITGHGSFFFYKPLNLTAFGAAFALEPSCDGPSCRRAARSISRVARLLCSGASAGFDCSAASSFTAAFKHL